MWFFGNKKENKKGIKKIDVYENKIVMDEAVLSFPLSLHDIEEVFGKPNRVYEQEDDYTLKILYVYDELGMVFLGDKESKKRHCKTSNIYTADNHNIRELNIFFGETAKPVLKIGEEEKLPLNTCNAKVTFEGFTTSFTSSADQRVGDFTIYYGISRERVDIKGGYVEKLDYPLEFMFSPNIDKKTASYKIPQNVENALHFDNINFKLAIIQVLMYDLEVLEPYFDIYEFAEQYKGKEIDTESCEIIRPAFNFFKKLPIPKELAEKVEIIYMDGGNEIYGNIIPDWDGEDEVFDLNKLTSSELKQFPNLKKAIIMSSNFEKVSKVFEESNIEVELL